MGKVKTLLKKFSFNVIPRKACDFCTVCSKTTDRPCNKKSVEPVPVPQPIPVPNPVPNPTPNPVPNPLPTPKPNPTTQKIQDWLTQDIWDTIFPYMECSAVYCPSDNLPFYSRQSFIDAIEWLNNHKDTSLHNFGTASSDININKYEIAAFLGNFQQETGDPSLTVPFSWLYPPAAKQTGPQTGQSGGGLCILEGLTTQVFPHKIDEKVPYKGVMEITLKNLRPKIQSLLGLQKDHLITCVVENFNSAYMPGFGLGTGNPSFQDSYVAVSDNGTLYGNGSLSKTDVVIPTKNLVASVSDRKFACLGIYCQTQGHGPIMLSYNYNFCDCSISLFSDYRVAKYPNLLTTVDRNTWNNYPKIFGFPGPNPDGKNLLPKNIIDTTPQARILSWISSIWFWMSLRSGRKISCHQCMMEPAKYGITSVNLIINNQSGNIFGTWASEKIVYYKRICNILQLDVGNTVVNPSGIQ